MHLPFAVALAPARSVQERFVLHLIFAVPPQVSPSPAPVGGGGRIVRAGAGVQTTVVVAAQAFAAARAGEAAAHLAAGRGVVLGPLADGDVRPRRCLRIRRARGRERECTEREEESVSHLTYAHMHTMCRPGERKTARSRKKPRYFRGLRAPVDAPRSSM